MPCGYGSIPAKLAARGLTSVDVTNALAEQNVEIPAGQVGQPPSDEKQTYQIPVRVIGRLSEPAEFDKIVVKNSPGGIVQLKRCRLRRIRRGDLLHRP
jgi:HAE1 family hydrophobic/amphiphilic exporter-1